MSFTPPDPNRPGDDPPNGYGQPEPPRFQIGPGKATGKQLLSACWSMLKQDRELLWLPAIAAVSGLVAALILFAPGFAIGWAITGGKQPGVGAVIGGILAAFAASAVAIYFQAALVIGANMRADGVTPTLRSVLREAATHRGKIISWAIVTTTVGAVIRAAEQRLGAVGTILGFLGGVAWAIASFLVVPVIVAEDLSPIAAVKRSASLIKQTWGTGLRTTLRFGIIQFLMVLPAVALIAIGAFVIPAGGGALVAGVVLVVIGAAALIALSMVFSAISSYARALLYRYATNAPIPGVPSELFAGAFRTRRRTA